MKTVPSITFHPLKKAGRPPGHHHRKKRHPVQTETEPAEERSWTGWTEIEEPDIPDDGVEPPATEDDLPEY